MMKDTSWETVVDTAIGNSINRKIIRDSDGNPSRLTYRDGAKAAAVLAASKQPSLEASISAICDTLAEYEVPVLLGEPLRTS